MLGHLLWERGGSEGREEGGGGGGERQLLLLMCCRDSEDRRTWCHLSDEQWTLNVFII